MPIDSDFSAPDATPTGGPQGGGPEVIRMLWFSMIASVFIISGMAAINPDFQPSGETSDPNWIMVGVLGAIAAMSLGLVAFAESWLAPRMKVYLVYCLARWSICESIAIYGFVLHILGAVIWVLPSFGLLALLGLLLTSPNEADVERWEQTQ